jgi:predicted protein tyrosine phosphatase
MIVNLFSRKTFDKSVYSDNEFYVCINSSGGDDSITLIPMQKPNIINLWFDDVEQDQRKWGEEVGHWVDAKAITYAQADNLYNFLKNISNDSVINVYCSKGVSRSGAVAEFLKREMQATVITGNEITPNKRVLAYLTNAKYKYIQVLNYKFSFDRLKEYYLSLENSYQHLKWTLDLVHDVNDAHKHKLDGVYGWGIQSNLEDLTKPCPPYDVHKHGSTTYRNTELAFGFAQSLLNRFPYGRQMGIAVHPIGVSISEHVDNDEFVKIHFPIFKSTASYFLFGQHKFILEPGTAYLLDTRYPHSTSQEGVGSRAHLLLKLPVEHIKDALA